MLNMYGFTLLYGNATTALNEPFTVVITEDKAIKYFGKTDVVGQTITIENFSGSKHDFIITGVLNKSQKIPLRSLMMIIIPVIFMCQQITLIFLEEIWIGTIRSLLIMLNYKKALHQKILQKPIALFDKTKCTAQFAADIKPYLVPLKDYYLSQITVLLKK